jgi:hypothetical protein
MYKNEIPAEYLAMQALHQAAIDGRRAVGHTAIRTPGNGSGSARAKSLLLEIMASSSTDQQRDSA